MATALNLAPTTMGELQHTTTGNMVAQLHVRFTTDTE
jgi:hypothetical protein